MNEMESIGTIPDGVVVDRLMPFLGPKDLLPGLGSTNKRLRELAKSDAVWREFCRWRGTTKSSIWRKMVYSCKVRGFQDLRSHRVRFDAFHEASHANDENALENYKNLHTSDWPILYLPCQGSDSQHTILDEVENEHTMTCENHTEFECQWPGCVNASCESHIEAECVGVLSEEYARCNFAVQFRTCDWCKLQICFECSHIIMSSCHICTKVACVDCLSVVGIKKTWRCCSAGCNRLSCGYCAWKVEGELDQGWQIKRVAPSDKIFPLRIIQRFFCSEMCAVTQMQTERLISIDNLVSQLENKRASATPRMLRSHSF
jgi:hypothetical protein